MKHLGLTISLLVTFVTVTLLIACGGTPKSADPTDQTPPTLSSSIPKADATAVPTNVKLVFNFSEAMNKASLNLASTPPITLGNPNWNAGSTSVVFDNSALQASTAYTLTLQAKDLAGNALANTILTFTTSDAADTTAPTTPTALVATPANGQVTLTWRPNPESDVVGYTVYMGMAEDVLEQHRFVSERSTTIKGLTNGTTYFFALEAVDGAANTSGKTAVVSATPSATLSDTTPPTLQSSDPADGATDVNPRNFSMRLVFSEPMDTATFAFTATPPQPFPPLMHVLGPAAATDFEVVWSEADTVATFEPTEVLLLENTPFTFTLTVAKDKAGNDLAGDNEIAFTTGEEAPRIVSSTPEDGATDVQVEPFEIKIAFSKPMDTSTFTVEPTLEPVDIPNHSQGWVLTWDATDTKVRITTSTPLPGYFLEDTTYTLALAGKSKAGLDLLDTSLSFKTVSDAVAPTVVTTSPPDGKTEQPLTPLDVFIYFDDLMDEASTLAAISSTPDLPCEWQHFFFTDSADDKDLGSAFACRSTTEAFQPGTTYTISVSTEAKDTSGNKLPIGICLGEPSDPPCAYRLSFTTLTPPPPRGNLQLDIIGLPLGQNRVRVTGPGGFDSGLLDQGTTFSNLPTGDYTITAADFVLAPGKPACRIYSAVPNAQTIAISANQTSSASVTYSNESCAF